MDSYADSKADLRDHIEFEHPRKRIDMDGKPRNLTSAIDDRIYPSGVRSVDLVYKPDTKNGESGLLVPKDFQQQAKDAVALYYNTYLVPMPGLGTPPIHEDDIFVVWFVKVLQNWKALCSTIFEDDRYFELTYDGDRRQLYIDEYVKKNNRVFILTPAGITMGPTPTKNDNEMTDQERKAFEKRPDFPGWDAL